MRMSAANKAKFDTLVQVLGYTEAAAMAVIYPRKKTAPAPAPEPERTPVDLLVDSGFTREEAEALVAEAPVVTPPPTPEEVRAAAVADAGFVFAKGRVYLHSALIDAAIAIKPGEHQIVPNAKGHGAVLVYSDEGAVALQPLFLRK